MFRVCDETTQMHTVQASAEKRLGYTSPEKLPRQDLCAAHANVLSRQTAVRGDLHRLLSPADEWLLLILFAFLPFGTSSLIVVRGSIIICTVESAKSFCAVEDNA